MFFLVLDLATNKKVLSNKLNVSGERDTLSAIPHDKEIGYTISKEEGFNIKGVAAD